MEMKPSWMRRAKTRTRKPMAIQLLEEKAVCEYAENVIATPTNPTAKAFALWFIFFLLFLDEFYFGFCFWLICFNEKEEEKNERDLVFCFMFYVLRSCMASFKFQVKKSTVC